MIALNPTTTERGMTPAEYEAQRRAVIPPREPKTSPCATKVYHVNTGTRYPSIVAASRATGDSHAGILRAMQRGTHCNGNWYAPISANGKPVLNKLKEARRKRGVIVGMIPFKSLDDAADYLHVSYETVRRWAKQRSAWIDGQLMPVEFVTRPITNPAGGKAVA